MEEKDTKTNSLTQVKLDFTVPFNPLRTRQILLVIDRIVSEVVSTVEEDKDMPLDADGLELIKQTESFFIQLKQNLMFKEILPTKGETSDEEA